MKTMKTMVAVICALALTTPNAWATDLLGSENGCRIDGSVTQCSVEAPTGNLAGEVAFDPGTVVNERTGAVYAPTPKVVLASAETNATGVQTTTPGEVPRPPTPEELQAIGKPGAGALYANGQGGQICSATQGDRCFMAYYPGPSRWEGWMCGDSWHTGRPARIVRNDATGGKAWWTKSEYQMKGVVCYDKSFTSIRCDEHGVGFSVNNDSCGSQFTTAGNRLGARAKWTVAYLFKGSPIQNSVGHEIIFDSWLHTWFYYYN